MSEKHASEFSCSLTFVILEFTKNVSKLCIGTFLNIIETILRK